MNKRSLWMSAAAALLVAAALAGCGTTTYFAGRVLPPSGLTNRVLIAIQNPSSFTKGALQIVDAFYDIRFAYDEKKGSFSISGYSGALPSTIQNMPEEQIGAVYGSGDGTFTLINYAKENTTGQVSGLNGTSSSVFITRNQSYVFAASQASHVLTVVNRLTGGSYPLSLPGVYRVSVNTGGSVVLAFVQNSNYAYYPRQLTAAQTQAYSGGPSTWPKNAEDCEPQNSPAWCLFQVQSPDHQANDAAGVPYYYGDPLVFDRPVKAVFSEDGGTAYVLNCGAECGGSNASVSLLPTGPLNFLVGQQSGLLPKTGAVPTISTPAGASNALIDSSIMYVVGQKQMSDYCGGGTTASARCWGGYLTVVNLSTNSVVPSTSTSPNPVSISDGAPGAVSRMILADDDTLWIGMTKCTNGERANNNLPYGCLTMFNTSTNTVTLLEPYNGDATGVAGVTGQHKIYTAEGGQIYIYTTTDGTAKDNQYVTVTGTAYDVAYMDGLTDGNNTVY